MIGGLDRLAPGTRVRLRPRRRPDVRSDLLDLALAGREAIVERIEEDAEGRPHVGIVLDDDRALELGLMRQIGHRFFFSPEELVPLPGPAPRGVLVAGLGDAFAGDLAFGSAVVEELRRRGARRGVQLADFGIRVRDLTAALEDGYDALLIVTAMPSARRSPDPKANPSRNAPGRVRVEQRDPGTLLEELGVPTEALPRRYLAVVLEPSSCTGAELSPAAGVAVPDAACLIEELVEGLLRGLLPQRPHGGEQA
jgi:Ni,Fe-hydrogenase maturation factor